MSANHRDPGHHHDQENRIRELKHRVEELAGGEMRAWESDTLSIERQEEFWRRILEYETAPLTTDFQQLIDAGVELPEPDAMDDERLTSKLWEVIGALARLRVFINETNHLSDRDLYSLLWRDILRQQVELLSPDPDAAWHVDLLGSGSETDTYLYLKHYADDRWRQQWLTDFPDYDMPAHEDPPYDRDHRLPRADDEPPS
jgi:hypothetical protein